MDPYIKLGQQALQKVVNEAVKRFAPPLADPQPPKPPSFDEQMKTKGFEAGTDGVYREIGKQPTPTPTPQLQPQVQSATTGGDGYRYAYETLPRDQEYTINGPRPNFQPQQPPQQISDIIRRNFPNEATQAAAVAASENATFESNRPDAINYKVDPETKKYILDAYGNKIEESRDRGIFQVNNGTFDGLMQRQGDRLRELGINSYEDMKDPEKNAVVAKMIKEGAQSYTPETNPNGWGGWFGWQDTGYDLNKGYYSENRRIKHAMKKKGKQ